MAINEVSVKDDNTALVKHTKFSKVKSGGFSEVTTEDLAIPFCANASAESGFISINLSKSFMPSLRYPDLYLQIPLLKSATSDLGFNSITLSKSLMAI